MLQLIDLDIITCRCGSSKHSRTNHSDCILNKKRIHLLTTVELENINRKHNEKMRLLKHNNKQINNNHLNLIRNERDNINKENESSANEKYLNIARKQVFSTNDIFGKYIQSDKTKDNLGRHLMPPRHISCPYCKALVWIEERRYKNK